MAEPSREGGMGSGRRIAVFGGTFDPVHLGHLRAALEVRERLSLDEVWLVPAAEPPHKAGTEASFLHRLEMVRLSVDGVDGMSVLDIEGRRAGPSYTLDTLEELASANPGNEWYLLLGSDAFLELETWKEFHRLVRLAALVVVGRSAGALEQCAAHLPEILPGYEEQAPGRWERRDDRPVLFVEVTRMEISSTMIRELVGQGRSARFLMPEAARKYMEETGLYAANRKSMKKNESLGSAKALAIALARAVEDNKGENVVVLDVSGASSFADFFVIAHGRSTRHVQGMADNIRRDLKKMGVYPRSVEGESEAKWILMDYGDVIVHLFYEPVRGFYDLEGLWHDVPRLDPATGDAVEKGEE